MTLHEVERNIHHSLLSDNTGGGEIAVWTPADVERVGTKCDSFVWPLQIKFLDLFRLLLRFFKHNADREMLLLLV